MNDQNETAQLRFLEETAIRLRQNGFTVEPIEDHHLPVCWEKGRLCRITGKGSVLYRQENVDSIRAQDALQVVIDTANWIRTEQEEMCFDMLACPYQDTCVKYGCPEIVAGFCRADDEAYGHMHPKLKWGRTKTLGQGGDCCDFRLTIE